MNRAVREARQSLAAARAPHYDVSDEVAQALEQAVQPPECPVCMESIAEPVRNDCCGHTFCRKCMYAHVVVYSRRQCPMCRATFDQAKIRAIVGNELVATPAQTTSHVASTPNNTLLELRVGNLHEQTSGQHNSHSWTCYVTPTWLAAEPPHGLEAASVISSVMFDLHPTFRPQVVTVQTVNSRTGSFSVARRGWGTFDIGITIKFKHSAMQVNVVHELEFGAPDTAVTLLVPVASSCIEEVRNEQSRLARLQRPSAAAAARRPGPSGPQPRRRGQWR